MKRFGDFVAVDGIDFDLQRGEAFGFLGPNGAGKTSTMRMIGCVSPVTDGTLSVFGLDPARDGVKIRGRLGVVPQQDTLDMELTVRENIVIYGRYFGLPRKELGPRADELLEFVELTERANDKVEPLSGGMKRRLTIARSLVNDPEVMLLDEPTTGLDPQARHVVWDRLYRLKRQGVTLVLTTHYMDEAEQLCDRLVVMDRGKIVAEGSPRDLIERYSTREVVELRFDDGNRPDDLSYWTDGLVEPRRVAPRPRAAVHAGRRRRVARPPRARARAGERDGPAQHARGRLPPPDRPEPHRVSSLTLALRPLEFFFAQYRRIWRGTAVTSVVTPVVYLLALGVGLGVFVDRSADLPEGISYLEFVAPGLMAATAMQLASFEASWPVLSAIKWDRQYHAMLATPLRVRDVMLGHQAFFAFRLLLTATRLLRRHHGVRRGRLAARGARDPGHRARRAVVHGATRRLGGAHGDRGVVRRDLPVRDPPDVPLLGDVLPDLEPPGAARGRRVADAALARRDALSRPHARRRRRSASDLLHLAYLLAWVTVGLVAARITYRRRLVAMTELVARTRLDGACRARRSAACCSSSATSWSTAGRG